MALYEIIYVSLAVREMTEVELVELLAKAQERNAQRGITGLLLYHRREFLQLIEGDRPDVESLFAAISRDARHQQIHTLWEGDVQARGFQRWSMGFVATDEAKLHALKGYESLHDIQLHQLPNGTAGKLILQHLRDEILNFA